MFFVLSPDMFHNRSESEYYTIIEDASGIVAKTQVKTSGVVIGKVLAVRLDGNQSRIDFSVYSDIKIPVGSEVVIREKGLLGDVFLEVIRAEDKGDHLETGAFIPPAQDQVSISKLITIANTIGKDIKKITSSFADVVGGEEGKENIGSIVTDVREVASLLRGILSENRGELKTIVSNFEKASTSFDDIMSGKKESFAKIVDNIKDVSEALKETLKDDNRQKIDRILASLDEAVGDIKAIAQKINSGEGTLGRLVNDETMIAEVEGAVKDIRELVSPAKKMQVEVDFRGEYKGNSRSQSYASLLLKPRPDKYYLVGITDVGEEEEDVQRDIIPVEEPDPNATSSTRYRERSVKSKNLRFNLQYAQRWNWAQFRFGLFETTGGFASDLFFFNDKLQFTVEGFDFRRNRRRNFGHLKAYTNFHFFNKHIYATIGADDLTRKRDDTGKQTSPLYFLGAGFRFTDEDLKSLFGVASSAL